MTRDEILSMPAGREMDALVATKVMGWHKNVYVNPTGSAARITWVSGELNHYETEDDWSPSTDIAAAWEVVEWLFKKGIVEISNGDGDSCDVGFFPSNSFDGLSCAVLTADTMPLAICRAALLAVMGAE